MTRAFIPEWLEKIAGVREKEILNHKSMYLTNYDDDYPEKDNRLPKGLYWIESEVGRFMINSKIRKIVA